MADANHPTHHPAANPAARPARTKLLALFSFALAVQTLLILLLPIQSARTYFTGETVILQTAPVDPYDIMRGYYVTLGYDISRADELRSLPGWEQFEPESTDYRMRSRFAQADKTPYIYVVLEQPQPSEQAESSDSQPPAAWEPVRVSATLPSDLAANQVALRGKLQYGWIRYGLESYYIPEDQRLQINAEISDIQWQNQSKGFVVEVRVNDQGDAVPTSLWVGETVYKF
ncbi:MAG: GDYXXLXY domain-containing protein [Thainema sp.]